MRAAVYKEYGAPEVVKIEEIDKPEIHAEDEGVVLIKVHNSSVNPYDYLFRSGYLPVRADGGLFSPKQQILGIDVAGTVEAVSKGVSNFKVGDRVFGNCVGAHAEYVRAREKSICLIPENVNFQTAAAVPTAGLTALQKLRDIAELQAGQSILINGASGGVGHFTVQLAKHFGAEVTAVCSTSNQAWVKELGADYMIDYSKEDFSKNGKQYDIVYDSVAKRTYFECRRSVKEDGLYILENPLKPRTQFLQIIYAMLIRRDKRVKMHLTKTTAEDLEFLAGLMQAGIFKPVIEQCYPLSDIVEAHRHVENGHTKGKVVLEV